MRQSKPPIRCVPTTLGRPSRVAQFPRTTKFQFLVSVLAFQSQAMTPIDEAKD